MIKPKLIAPAGNLEKLKIACLYGADAVYFGGQNFNLRIASQNLSNHEIEEGVSFAHNLNKEAYCLLNSFMHDEDISELKDFICFIAKQNIDGVIVSDLGVLELVKENSSIPIVLSTQASCVNGEAAKFYESLGVKRIVLGREVSIENASKLKEITSLEVEMFAHGAMCMGFSGNCSFSTYLQNRDSNRGGCGHACRFTYNSKDINNNIFFSSKDLCGMPYIDKFFEKKIDALKIEGRMKSNLYLATVVRAYSIALNEYKNKKYIDASLYKELLKVSHREYFSGNLINKASNDSILNEIQKRNDCEYLYVGEVIEELEENESLIYVKNPFHAGDTLEVLSFDGENVIIKTEKVYDVFGTKLENVRPNSVIKAYSSNKCKVLNVIRKKIKRALV